MTEHNVPIRPASTILLLRDEPRLGLEVFMVKRHADMDFMGGALVFPGGKVDDNDHLPAMQSHVRSGADIAAQHHAFAIAAIREAFEEAGILLARRPGSDDTLTADEVTALAPYRAELVANRMSMAAFLAQEKIELALDLLVPFAHWITPVIRPKRFDTWFFLAPTPAGQLGVHDGSESVDSVWITPNRALADADAKRRLIMTPTRLNLEKLSRAPHMHAALQLARASTVVTVLPEVARIDPDGTTIMRIPAEADYGMSEVRHVRGKD